MSALRTTFQVILVVCLVILAAAALLLVSRLLGWPLRTVGWVLAGLVAAVLAVRFVPLLWRKIAEARSRAAPTPLEAAAAQRVASLREQWKALLQQLRASKLGARAVTALPWFVVLGSQGSGKTSAVRNCQRAVGASAPVAAPGRAGGLGWALLDRAVVLDSPSSWLQSEENADRAEWMEFLSLVAKTRRDAGFDGVVAVVAADALLRKSAEEIKADAGVLRQRLDEAIRRLGVRFPVYVLVTHLDKVEGMARFVQCLPEKALEQAVGAFAEPGEPAQAFGESVVDRFVARLGELRLTILAEPRFREAQRQALLFPEETGALRQPLGLLLGTAFASDPYRESPLLRGVFFSSAHQEGRAAPGLLARLGFPDEVVPAPTEDRSYFLSGFFGSLLPGDRGLTAPTSRALTLRTLTRNLGLTVWSAVWILLAVILVASFVRNLSVLREIGRQVPSKADLTGRPNEDLATVDRLRASAESLRARNSGFGLGRVLLPHASRAEEALWAEHDRRFRTAVLDPLDRSFDGRLDRLLAQGAPDELAAVVDLLVKRVNLLSAASGGGKAPEELARLDQPSYAWFLGAPDSGTLVMFHRNYLAHLARGDDRGALPPELKLQRERLSRVLNREGAALDWLVDWANLQPALKPVGLEAFWGAALPGPDAPMVKAAYTPAGWKELQRFLDQMGSAFSGSSGFAQARSKFEASYRRGYFDQWEKFLLAFSKGEAAFPGRDRKADLTARFGGRDSPYAKLLTTLPEALEPAVGLAAGAAEVPGWVSLAYRWDRFRQPAYQEVLKRSQGALGTVAAKGSAVLGKLWEKLEGAQTQDATVAEDARAFPYWGAYHDGLIKTAERVRSAQAGYQLAKDVFAEADLAVGDPQQPVSRLYWSVNSLRRILGKGAVGEEVFWQLLTRQADTLWAAVIYQAEVLIEKAWAGDVLGAAAGLTGLERVDALQGPAGKVWEFQDKITSPFLTKAIRRPDPKVAYGARIHFSPAFLDLLGRGKVGQQAIRGTSRVQVSALPTDVNPEATVKPHMTRLVLQCNAGSQELVNQNFPVGRTFNWSPEECADTTLEIGIGNLVLKRWYAGADGFARFLGDFRGGRKVFSANDFPDQRPTLAAQRVTAITVNYAFRGQEGVLGSAATAPPRVPDRVIVQ